MKTVYIYAPDSLIGRRTVAMVHNVTAVELVPGNNGYNFRGQHGYIMASTLVGQDWEAR